MNLYFRSFCKHAHGCQSGFSLVERERQRDTESDNKEKERQRDRERELGRGRGKGEGNSIKLVEAVVSHMDSLEGRSADVITVTDATMHWVTLTQSFRPINSSTKIGRAHVELQSR